MQMKIETELGQGARHALTMEERSLAVIALLEKAEMLYTNAGNLPGDIEAFPPTIALQIGEAKQAAIDHFAMINRKRTLASLRQRCEPSAETGDERPTGARGISVMLAPS